MNADNKLVFRQEALDNIYSPEEFSQLMNIVKPQTWLPLLSGGSLVIGAGIWSVTGRIPITVTGTGVLVYPHSVAEIQTVGEGQLASLNIQSGDSVTEGQVIGKIDQSQIKQELVQQKAELVRLRQEVEEKNELQKQQVEQEITFLQQQQEDLKSRLEREKLAPVLHQKTVEALQQKRATLQSNIEREQITPELYDQKVVTLAEQKRILQEQKRNLTDLLANLEQRLESYRSLYQDKRAISYNLFLQAQQEVIGARRSVLDLEAQLNNLEVQKTSNERDYLRNLSALDELENQLQELEIQRTQAEFDFTQNKAELDRIATEIKGLEAEKIRLNQQDLALSFEQDNKVKEIKNRIAQLELQLSQGSEIVSQYEGRVLELGVLPGQVIDAGTAIGKIQIEDTDAELQSVVYFDDKGGKKIESGMDVQVIPSIVKQEKYGGIVGEVSRIFPYTVTTNNIASIVGNESLAKNLAATDAARVQVFVDLEENPDNQSGYNWSSSGDPKVNISSGTTTQVKVKVDEVAPISYIVPLFRSLTGIN